MVCLNSAANYLKKYGRVSVDCTIILHFDNVEMNRLNEPMQNIVKDAYTIKDNIIEHLGPFSYVYNNILYRLKPHADEKC